MIIAYNDIFVFKKKSFATPCAETDQRGRQKASTINDEVLQSMFKWYTLHNSLSEKRYTYLILVRIIRCVNFCQKKKLLQKTILLLSARCTIFQWIICFSQYLENQIYWSLRSRAFEYNVLFSIDFWKSANQRAWN